METGGDERYGFYVAGASLIALGWGVMVVLNFLLHRWAGAQGSSYFGFNVHPAFGPFAWASAVLGGATGVIGIVLVQFGRGAPAGPFVLPGQPY
jgi:hypothetical protein